ncbi:MAG: AAA family ATPase [Rhodocyclales bacterium]|nr:AAA family ATPase [Rhodocyclales bacterium]
MGLYFKTLGVPELFTREQDTEGCLRLRYRKAYAVLGYLVVERERWHERKRLASLFWPRLAPEAALANLRQILKNLGDVFAATVGMQCLRVERDRLGLFFDNKLHADVLLFADANRDALRRCADGDAFLHTTAAWVSWMEQMEGEFLAGIDADDNGEFEDWLLLQRASCDRARAAFLKEYMQTARRCDAAAAALMAARIWVRCRPEDDAAAQAQMELLASLAQPAAALDAYTDFAQRLQRLVNGTPGADTEELRRRIAASAVQDNDAPALAAPPRDEVRRLVVLRIEPDLNDEADALEPESHLAPLAEALDKALARWNGRHFLVSGWALGAVFGLADDGEQAPRRALLAALEIAAAPGFGRTRIGICEGKALVSPTARHPLAGSSLPSLAQRLALCGDPGSVVVALSLAGELGRHASFETLPRRQFTGLAGEHTPCRLLAAASTSPGPYPVTSSTPFVGREEERARLAAAIAATAQDRRVAFIEVTGLAGKGKSRLLAEVARAHRANGGEIRWIGHRPELRHASLGGLREELRRLVGASGAATLPSDVGRWLDRYFPAQRANLQAPVQAFLNPADDGAAAVSGRGLIEALLTLLFSPARTEKPVLLVFDDLHWADEATRELLRIAIQSPPRMAILAVLASRPGAGIELPEDADVPRIVLQPLALAEATALIAAVDQDDCISAARRAQLAKMSGGLPLCAEYIARAARDQAVSDASLFGVLQSVLDRLGPDKQVLQAAAVIGAAFRGTSLRALLPDCDPTAALQQAEALAICDRTGEDAYVFRHALLRDCAYDSIPPKLRRDWHRRAAAWLARQPDAAAADIAQHFEAAQAWREAVNYWWQAAETAYLDEFAGDAKAAAERALAVAAKNGEALATADKAELELLAGYATLMAKGYGAKDAQRFFAPLVADAAGTLPDETLIRALCGMAAATPTGRLEMLATMRRIEAKARTPAHRMMVCYGYGSLQFWRGELAASRCNLEEAIQIGQPLSARNWLRYAADNPAVGSRALLGVNLAFSGASAEAQETAVKAVADARREGRAHGLCFALTMAASVNLILDHPDEVERFATEGRELGRQWHFQLWHAYNTLFGYWAQARQGRLRMNETFKLVSMHRQFAAASRLSPVTSLWFTAAIFESLESWALLDTATGRALALVEKGGDRYCLPDLMRQKALARHGRGDTEGARQWLEQASTLAAAMGTLVLLPRLRRDAARIGLPLAHKERLPDAVP